MSSSAGSELQDRKEKSMAHLGHLVDAYDANVQIIHDAQQAAPVILEGQHACIHMAVICASVCRVIECADSAESLGILNSY